MVLVLYCGAVVFLTKPDSFAYSAFFEDIGSHVTINPSSNQSAAVAAPAAEIDTDAIMAEAQAIAEKKASEIAQNALADSNASMQKYVSESLPAIVDEAVKNALAQYDITDEVAQKVIDEVLTHDEEFAQMIYDKYSEAVEASIKQEVLDSVADAIDDQSLKSVTADEYESQRKVIRESEINNLLNQLED